MSAGNPYDRVGKVAVGDHFVERRQPGRKIEQTWKCEGVKPGNLSVLGHHRTGKTSLVHWAAARCDRTDLNTIFIDVGTLASGQELFRSIIREALRVTESPANLEPIAAAGLEAGTWDDLRYAVGRFFAVVRANGHHMMVVLDEFDRASEACSQRAEFQLLRNLASEDEYSIGLITVSRRRVADIEIDAAGGSILGGVLSLIQPVGMFTPAEADIMLARAMPLGIDLRPVHGQILDLTGLHPYLLERLCYSIVDHYEDTGEVDVDRAYEKVMGIFADHFNRLAEVIKRDLGDSGLALLRDLAGGTAPARKYGRELSQWRELGLVASSQAQPVLFAASFARHVLAL